ncbi:DUF3048 domain-containing protein [Candidatus Parcubacteria bacterium]|nr:MAG: DUF3048 domain-containing protein [Candidatus Parcubacteria bacterium]
MLTHKTKIYLAITVIFVAVILLVFGIINLLKENNSQNQEQTQVENKQDETFIPRHPLSGLPLDDSAFNCLPISIMIENAYDILPQKGLAQADIVYEALAEANITRLLAIYDSTKSADKIGPIRSARPYFMDWAEEYGGIYMHVGGSPQALNSLDNYDLIDVDQIGAGEVYFWRDQNIDAPHNVFTSNSNWLRAAEIRGGGEYYCKVGGIGMWNFKDVPNDYSSEGLNLAQEIKVDFSSDLYEVNWKLNQNLKGYQRWQSGDKYIYDNGEQVVVSNVIVQLADTKIIDDIGRRQIDTQSGGKVYVFNIYGVKQGQWKLDNGRTRFYDNEGKEIELVPGKSWIEIIPGEENISYQ